MSRIFRNGVGHSYSRGYVSAQAPLGDFVSPDSIQRGSGMWCRNDGYTESWKALTSATANYGGTAILFILDPGSPQIGAIVGTGTVIIFRAGTVWFVGSGVVYKHAAGSGQGTSLGTASSGLQLVLSGGTLITAGLSQPAAPTISLTGSGKITGSVSVKITRNRTTTGAESNASVATNIIAGNSQMIRISSWPAALTNQDGWGIYATDPGFSTFGPWYHRKDILNSDISGGNYDFDYYASETDLIAAPFDNFTPPAATHVCSLGSCLILLGTFGGAGISPSKIGFPEAFPPSYTRFLNPADSIVNVDGRSANGWLYVICKQSVQAVLLSGDDEGPVFGRSVWPFVGFLAPHAYAMNQSEIVGHASDGNFVISSGFNDPETGFVRDVWPDVKNWNPASTVTGIDGKNNCIVFANGTTAIPWMRWSSEGPKWSTPMTLPSAVKARINIGGQLYLQLADNQLYSWDQGSGGAWEVVPASLGDGNSLYTLEGWRTTADPNGGTITSNLYGNKTGAIDLTTVLESQSLTGTGQKVYPRTKVNVKGVRQFCVGHSGTGAGVRLGQTVFMGAIDDALADAA